MTDISIVCHSGYGHTEELAEAVLAGMQQVDDVAAALLTIDAEGNLPDGAWPTLKAADAIVFGSPTDMGNASWQFKKFADATSKPWYGQEWKIKLFAGFTNSASVNGDKSITVGWRMALAMQHAGLWIGMGDLPSSLEASTRDDVNSLGSYSRLYSQSPADASPDEAPGRGDLETARRFGKRVAEAAKSLASAKPVET